MKEFDEIYTLDLEGDSRSAEINQAMFPNGCHFDPNTRIWCATISRLNTHINCSKSDLLYTVTLVCKLPETARQYDDPPRINGRYIFDTGIFHNKESQVRINDIFRTVTNKWTHDLEANRIIKVTTDYDKFLSVLVDFLIICSSNDKRIYVKPYIDKTGKLYNYDKLALANAVKDRDIDLTGKESYRIVNDDGRVTSAMRNYNLLDRIVVWNPKDWERTASQGIEPDNEKFMNNGIIHNIEDTEQLNYRIWEETALMRKKHMMKERISKLSEDF